MSANIPNVGKVRTLDRIPGAQAPLTERDVAASSTLVRLLGSILREVAQLGGKWRPRRLDFEDRTVLDDGTTKYRFEHRFGGRVRYWVVEWVGDDPPNLRKDSTTDENTLVLTSTVEGVATIRVEEAG